MRRILRSLKYGRWALNGFIGRTSAIDQPETVTVLITYFNPKRMAHINHQLRHILKCEFVDRIIVSNHNPEICIEHRVSVQSDRIVCVNQQEPRGCGHRWNVAQAFNPAYMIVADDDLLLTASQIRYLFSQLLIDPAVPHGYAGMINVDRQAIEYRENEEMEVDYLCEIYAVTNGHLQRYEELYLRYSQDDHLRRMIDGAADFMLISNAGAHRPRIHHFKRLFRCATFKDAGVAVHQQQEFADNLDAMRGTLEKDSANNRAVTPIALVPSAGNCGPKKENVTV